ncbi:MAG: hypothetical protein ACLFPU_09955 [Dehalococcoidia bacterium]
MVRNIVENNDGSISVESEEGQGTTFIVTLPLARNEVPQSSHSGRNVISSAP